MCNTFSREFELIANIKSLSKNYSLYFHFCLALRHFCWQVCSAIIIFFLFQKFEFLRVYTLIAKVFSTAEKWDHKYGFVRDKKVSKKEEVKNACIHTTNIIAIHKSSIYSVLAIVYMYLTLNFYELNSIFIIHICRLSYFYIFMPFAMQQYTKGKNLFQSQFSLSFLLQEIQKFKMSHGAFSQQW